MMNHEVTIDLIPEYVSGLLTQDERAQVEAHMRECVECQKLAETCSALSVDLKSALHDELLDHPSTEELSIFAISPEGLSEELRQRVTFHLEVCSECVDDLLAAKGLDSEVQYDNFPRYAGKSTVASGTFGDRLRRLFAKPMVVVPVSIAVLTLLAIPVLKSQFGDSTAPSDATVQSGSELTVALAEQTRSGLSRRVVTLQPEHQSVKLEMRFIGQTERNYSVQIATNAGRVVHQERLSAESAQQGLVQVSLGAGMLPDGDYNAVVMSVTAQGDPLRVYYPFTVKR